MVIKLSLLLLLVLSAACQDQSTANTTDIASTDNSTQPTTDIPTNDTTSTTTSTPQTTQAEPATSTQPVTPEATGQTTTPEATTTEVKKDEPQATDSVSDQPATLAIQQPETPAATPQTTAPTPETTTPSADQSNTSQASPQTSGAIDTTVTPTPSDISPTPQVISSAPLPGAVTANVPDTTQPSQPDTTTVVSSESMTNSIPSVAPKLTTNSISTPAPSVFGHMMPQGHYSVAFLNSSLSPMNVSVSNTSIGYTGCNSFTIVCQFFINNGTVTFSKPIATTTKQCQNNNDAKYLTQLTKANGCLSHQNAIYLTSSGKKFAQFKKLNHLPSKLHQKHPIKPNKVLKPKATKVPLTSFIPHVNQGTYSFSSPHVVLPPLVVHVSSVGIGFTGCNTILVPFISHAQGAIKVNGNFSSTSNQCPVNNDHQYIQLFQQADGYKHTGQNFCFTHRGSSIAQFNFINHQIMKIGPKVNIKPPTISIAPPISILPPPIPQPIHIITPPVPQIIPPPINIIAPPIVQLTPTPIIQKQKLVQVKLGPHVNKQQHPGNNGNHGNNGHRGKPNPAAQCLVCPTVSQGASVISLSPAFAPTISHSSPHIIVKNNLVKHQ